LLEGHEELVSSALTKFGSSDTTFWLRQWWILNVRLLVLILAQVLAVISVTYAEIVNDDS
jgi:uncharacterized integral membrane protein